jgi:hypothetical protein
MTLAAKIDASEPAIYRVDTVPPPDGEDDAYSAPTRVGPLARSRIEEMMAESEPTVDDIPVDSGVRPRVIPPPPRAEATAEGADALGITEGTLEMPRAVVAAVVAEVDGRRAESARPSAAFARFTRPTSFNAFTLSASQPPPKSRRRAVLEIAIGSVTVLAAAAGIVTWLFQ